MKVYYIALLLKNPSYNENRKTKDVNFYSLFLISLILIGELHAYIF